ncbi:hypothetical protein [Bifidobacterium canis]|uniref:Uncharacterized protein n=1 Tax=Bifidobacterium canis TaxID=2610880 RepID=A0A7K1J3Z0_9BIFI|nr:hypothetical protein [Bifidobacterium canis]MUH59357.1 hypothetical protein [Bifidobacterium canis]
MNLFLVALSGICWTIVYIELIRLGFRDKTCGMPVFALALNFAWELIYSYDGLFGSRSFMAAQNAADVAWVCCDALIVATWFAYGRHLLPQRARSAFPFWSFMTFASCLAMQLAFYLHFPNKVAASQYSAFAQNAAMSIMFVIMFYTRDDLKGQSPVIAVCKCIGTLAPTILGGFLEGFNVYIVLMGAVSFAFDISYIVLVTHAFRRERSKVQLTSKVAVNGTR